MAITSLGYPNALLAQSVATLKTEMANLQNQLATGEKSTTYSGMGSNEGLAIAARSQISNISAFTNTITNVGTTIDAENTALQSISTLSGSVQNQVASEDQTLNSSGQTLAQQSAASEFNALIGMLNTQSGNDYLFSGSATNTPSTASADAILNGSGAQAGLTQVISERNAADGVGSMGRLTVSQPSSTSVSVSQEAGNSVFGMQLASVSSTLSGGATVSGPTGSPPSVSVALGSSNLSAGDQISLTFNLPDGTTSTVQLTASSANPPPSGSFSIGSTVAATAANLSSALTSAIGTTADTSLAAASDVAAANDFFEDPPMRVDTTTTPYTDATVTGSVATDDSSSPVDISGTTALSGTSGAISPGFSAGDTITVDGQTLTFVSSGASGANQINVSDNISTLLAKVDALSGATTPSSVSGGAITLHTGTTSDLTITSSDSAALAALGLGSSVDQARGGGPTSLVAGTSANTVMWYTGASATGSPRASLTARVDQSQTVQYGIQANESAISTIVKNVALLAAVTTSPTNPNAANQVSELSSRITTNMSTTSGQQSITDIESDLASAQTTMQTNLQASYQTTSMLSQLSLVKYLPIPS